MSDPTSTPNPMLSALLSSQSLAAPLHDALAHMARAQTQRLEHVAALEAMCGDLLAKLDAQQMLAEQQRTSLVARLDEQAEQAVQREAALLSRLEVLEELLRDELATKPQESFSPTLLARLVHPKTSPTLLNDFVVVDLPTTPFGSPLSESRRISHEPVQQLVSVPTVFAIQRTPLVWSQWARVQKRSTDHPMNEPVQGVMVWGLVKLCNMLSALDGLEPCYQLLYEANKQPRSVRFLGVDRPGYRLPLAVEWEAAARAGQVGSQYGEPDRIAWHAHNSEARFHEVGRLQPNALGLHDMLGHVSELVWADVEQVEVFFKTSTATIGQRDTPSHGLISCGGSRLYGPLGCRFSTRSTCKLTSHLTGVGVRLVRTLQVREVST